MQRYLHAKIEEHGRRNGRVRVLILKERGKSVIGGTEAAMIVICSIDGGRSQSPARRRCAATATCLKRRIWGRRLDVMTAASCGEGTESGHRHDRRCNDHQCAALVRRQGARSRDAADEERSKHRYLFITARSTGRRLPGFRCDTKRPTVRSPSFRSRNIGYCERGGMSDARAKYL